MLLNGIRLASLLLALLICFFTGGFESLHFLWILPAGYAGSYLILTASGFGILILLCKRVDLSVPQEHDSPFYRKLLGMVADAALGLLKTRLHTEGLEKIPTEGRVMIVCNHLSFMDPVLLAKYFKKNQIAFISKKENADMFIIGPMMHKTMCQMIDRDNDRAALKTILNCIRLLKEDEVSICAFPEGYISTDRKLRPFRPGVFKIATKAKVPIVVCTLDNTYKILPSAAHLKPVDASFHVLDVITPEAYENLPTTEIADRIYQMMLSDLGPAHAPAEDAIDNT